MKRTLTGVSKIQINKLCMIDGRHGEAVAEVLLRMPTVTLLPDGRSHATGGMLADSKCANLCISKKLMKAILNLTRR